MPFLPAHIIGHGWRDLLLYGGAGFGMAAGFWVFISGRSARLHRDQPLETYEDSAESADQPSDVPFVRRDAE